jgi:hypothetical protein
MGYKYHSAVEYDQIIRETEAEMDRRIAQQADADRLAKVAAWTKDPANAAQLARIRAEFDRIAPQRPTQPQAPQHPTAPSTPQYKTRAQLEQERPWLRDPKPGSFARIIDPLAR